MNDIEVGSGGKQYRIRCVDHTGGPWLLQTTSDEEWAYDYATGRAEWYPDEIIWVESRTISEWEHDAK